MKKFARFGFCFDLLWCASLVFISTMVIYLSLIIGTSVALKPTVIEILNISDDSVKKIEKINDTLICPLYSSYTLRKEKER